MLDLSITKCFMKLFFKFERVLLVTRGCSRNLKTPNSPPLPAVTIPPPPRTSLSPRHYASGIRVDLEQAANGEGAAHIVHKTQTAPSTYSMLMTSTATHGPLATKSGTRAIKLKPAQSSTIQPTSVTNPVSNITFRIRTQTEKALYCATRHSTSRHRSLSGQRRWRRRRRRRRQSAR